MRLATYPTTSAPPTIAWEERACLLCGGARLTPLLESSDSHSGLKFLLVRCQRCGLCYTNPRPDSWSVQQFYPDTYRCHQAKEPSRRADPMKRILAQQTPARLLDFGCGGGDFLARMHEAGWTVTGLDASGEAAGVARARGFAAHAGTLPHPLWMVPSFEAITMRQSLEHTHEPLEVLEAAHHLLTPGGRLLVSVPNFDSLGRHWFGGDWHGLDVPRHLIHFTPATLKLMLYRAGFSEIALRQISRPSWIRHSAIRAGDRRWLRSRFGSGLAAAWARLRGHADCLLATATRA